MFAPLDGFKVEDGVYIWKATAESFQLAKSTVQRLATTSPGEYMIYSQTTGNKIVVKLQWRPMPRLGGNQFPSFNLLQSVNSGRPSVALSLLGHLSCLTDERIADVPAKWSEPRPRDLRNFNGGECLPANYRGQITNRGAGSASSERPGAL
jgi:hypothetical protein